MRKYIILLILAGAGLLLPTSCLKEYLDKAPEAGLEETEVFSKYANFLSFFEQIYDGQETWGTNARNYNLRLAYPLYFDFWDQKYTWEGMTDAVDGGRYMEGHSFKGGLVAPFINKFTYDGNRRPILQSMWKVIRISNIALLKVDNITDATLADKDDFRAQAFFVRAFAHFELFKLWGPMPYVDEPIAYGDQFDLSRLPVDQYLTRVSQDLDSAYKYFVRAGKIRRDTPTNIGTASFQRCPNGVTAKAMKSRVLLFAASPLNNKNGVTDWQKAAVAAREALEIALAQGYTLLPLANYKDNFVGKEYTNEAFWSWYGGDLSYNNGDLAGIINGVFGNSVSSFSGECPTQNFVDEFETKWGEPLVTEANRAAAIAALHYKDQDPYANRDPRFYRVIIYNQATGVTGWTGGKAQIYYEYKDGVPVYSELLDQKFLGITRTGYYSAKRWAGRSAKNTGNTKHSAPLIRLAELYLNYAESVNEAYGPTGTAPGYALTAVGAINAVRARATQQNVLAAYTGSIPALRERIKNERHVELCFEGHYFFDIRRWKDAPMKYSSVIMGMDIEKVPVSTNYPLGFKHTRVSLPLERQSAWKDAMYLFPFNPEDNYKMTNFTPNPTW